MKKLLLPFIIVAILLTGCITENTSSKPAQTVQQEFKASITEEPVVTQDPVIEETKITPEIIPETVETPVIADFSADALYAISYPDYIGEAYTVMNDNVPYFIGTELCTSSYEYYSELDSIGRCGTTYACIGQEIMPTEERGEIGQVKPTGWQTVKYNDLIDGNYLYNRCHLIGFQLTGENANIKNLITGTRYMNVEGMLPFENMVADFVTETDMHVMYRVTPIFEGDNLIAKGVLMEGYSIEDNGDGISFNVFVHNIQPGISIDYASGNSWVEESETESEEIEEVVPGMDYILNTNTKKFHYPICSSVDDMKEKNKEEFTGTRDDIISRGYESCGRCHP